MDINQKIMLIKKNINHLQYQQMFWNDYEIKYYFYYFQWKEWEKNIIQLDEQKNDKNLLLKSNVESSTY